MTAGRQSAIGLGLAALIVGGWATLHVWGVFFQPLTWPAVAVVPLIILTQSWLGAGMFIVAHDAMHGSLAPGRPRVNAVVGQICVGAYAAFSYRKLSGSHHQHHRTPGQAEDPDFHAARPEAFAYLLIGAHVANVILFWALPAILSALQLFVFGTWLPHRHDQGAEAFADRHNARTIPMPWIASLLTCFHFGMHHEHHLSPGTPWWRLPELRRASR